MITYKAVSFYQRVFSDKYNLPHQLLKTSLFIC